MKEQSTAAGILTDLAVSPSILVAPVFPPFRTQGNAIKDGEGNKVLFRGIEREGQTWNSFPADTEIAQIRAWGANFVRIPLSESLWLNTCLSTSPSNDPNYPKKVDAEVGSITGRGMVALIELNYNVTQACGKPAAQRMADAAFSPTFWQQVATRYKSNQLVAFDLYNEPHDVNDAQWLNGGAVVSGTTSYQAAGMQQLYDTVRATGAANLIFIAGRIWATTPATTMVSGTNIVHSVHVYSSDPNTVLKMWDAVGRTAPIMNTEFGSNNFGSDGAYNSAVIADCEQHGWGWNAYAFDGTAQGNYDLITNPTTYDPAPAGLPVKNGLALNV